MTGTYIVLEGAQGTGKTTLAELVVRQLEGHGVRAQLMQEPDGQRDPTAAEIRRLTQDPAYPMNSRTEVLLYNAARSQSLEHVRRARAAGVVCVVDRSYLSTLATQFYGRGDIADYRRLNDIIEFAVADMWPDCTIVLDAPAAVLYARTRQRGGSERFDTLDMATLERIRAGYLWEADQRKLPVVTAVGDVSEVFAAVWQYVARAVGLPQPAAAAPVAVADILAAKARRAAVSQAASPRDMYMPPGLSKELQTIYRNGLAELLDNQQRFMQTLREASAQSGQALPPGLAAVIADSLCPLGALPDSVGTLRCPPPAPAEVQLALSQATGGSYSQFSQGVQLAGYSPRNELLALSVALYDAADVPFAQLQQLEHSLSYETRSQLWTTYLQTSTDTRALRALHYTWEGMADAALAGPLQELFGEHLLWQPPTPRYGYATPPAVEAANLADAYDSCFDASVRLYSTLQASGHDTAAALVTLGGHTQRWLVPLDGQELWRVLHSGNHTAEVTALTDELLASLRTVHPLLADAIDGQHRD